MGAPDSVPLPGRVAEPEFDGAARLRLLLYSPDPRGLGELRRSVNLAGAAVRRLSDLEVTILTGSPRATIFALPERVEVVKIPTVGWDAEGALAPRSLSSELSSVLALRARLLAAAIETWRPDVLVVDQHPLGLGGELADVLPAVRAAGVIPVLGLRDVVDSSRRARTAFAEARVREALSEYEAICVYGARAVCDPGEEYDLPADARRRIEFTGYVTRPAHRASVRPLVAARPQVLVTLGGGGDGAELAELVLSALELATPTWDTVLVLGPLMDERLARHFKRRGRRLPGVDVHTFYGDLPRLMSESDLVLSRAGYSTVAEILESGVPSVLVPRQEPQSEQEIRARRLADAGLVRRLEDRSAQGLRRELEAALDWRPDRTRLPSLEGGARMGWLLEGWLGSRRSSGVA